jgi:hypothetical protein
MLDVQTKQYCTVTVVSSMSMHVSEWSGVQKHSVTECETKMSSMHEECKCYGESKKHDVREMHCNDCNHVHKEYLKGVKAQMK